MKNINKSLLSLALMITTVGFVSAQDKDKEGKDSTRTVRTTVGVKHTSEGTQVEVSSGSDSVVIPMDGGRLIIKFEGDTSMKRRSKEHHHKKKPRGPRSFWSGLEVGVVNYLDASGGMNVPKGYERFELNQAHSWHFGFNLFEKTIPIYRHNVALLTGLGFDYENYSFNSRQYAFDQPDTVGQFMERDYTNNRLRAYYATVPLMLGLDFSKPGKSGLHIAAGVVGGVRFASSTKQKYETEEGTVIRKVKDDFDLNPFRLNAQARVGYGGFTLFANYSLTSMFKNTPNRPELYPVSVGIAFGG